MPSAFFVIHSGTRMMSFMNDQAVIHVINYLLVAILNTLDLDKPYTSREFKVHRTGSNQIGRS